jgi:colanic acid/amylovoran biosynthesis glycosyltransferase
MKRARLWVVCRTLGGPSEVWLYRQLQSFRRLMVEVVCWTRENESVYPLENIPVHQMPFDPSPQNGSGRWWYRLRVAPGRNFYATVGREFRALSRAVRESRPDVILCHYGHVALRLLPVAGRFGLPLVAHFHGVDISAGLRNRWYRWSLQRNLHRFDALVVVAEYQREQLLRLGASEKQIHVIPCGVPVDEITPAREVGAQPCQFLAVGRFVPKKGPLLTLRAFARCAAQVPGVRLTWVGDGPLLREAQQLADELGVGRRVDFAGNQPSEQVMRAMGRAGVFVQHSMTDGCGDKEGWPVSIAEAMATGLPVVATRHADIVKQVQSGQSGYLVEEGDWMTMSDHMIKLAREPALRVQMGQKSREVAENHFRQRQLVERLEGVLMKSFQTVRVTETTARVVPELDPRLGSQGHRPV